MKPERENAAAGRLVPGLQFNLVDFAEKIQRHGLETATVLFVTDLALLTFKMAAARSQGRPGRSS